MCGIAGLFGPDGSQSSIAEQMASLLAHRGPDGIHAWGEECQHGGVSLGHARLSIVDLAGSDQPLHSDSGCVLIQNGEIYNHLSIRDAERSFPYRTKGDGES
ncbi:MAG TPA: asparagine synthetase B, partial [Candidatus Poseidoniales archaeon]|nr:asparagine synthetase B [Candidatus Poseidoniales archaeon]